MGGSYLFFGSNLEKYGKIWKNCRFSGRIWPDWGNTTRADLAGLGSIGTFQRLNTHHLLLVTCEENII